MKIITRKEWNARSPLSVHTTKPFTREFFIIHHSGGPADQSVRAIQDWCMDNRKFSDIDYNFLVRSTTGEIYAGRGWDVIGAHTVGHNTDGIGVCLIGSTPLPQAKQSLRWLYRQASTYARRGLTVRGHRDFAPTECPGNEAYHWARSNVGPAQRVSRTLKLESPRMTGSDVMLVQDVTGIEKDGIFGPITDMAVTRWKRAGNLDPNGIVDLKTARAMCID